jgi:CRP/FNR family transcriptional regulator, cyclic AMP receptor protein
MRTVLDHCTGRSKRHLPAGATIIREGGNSGHLFVLIEGSLEVVRGDKVVAKLTEPGAIFGEMSVLLDQPHTATVRTASEAIICEFDDAKSFLRDEPDAVLIIAQLLAQRLNVATTYLSDLIQQYSSHGTHLSMVGELLQTMINLPPTRVSPGSDLKSDPRL